MGPVHVDRSHSRCANKRAAENMPTSSSNAELGELDLGELSSSPARTLEDGDSPARLPDVGRRLTTVEHALLLASVGLPTIALCLAFSVMGYGDETYVSRDRTTAYRVCVSAR